MLFPARYVEGARQSVAGIVDQALHLQPPLPQCFDNPPWRRRVGKVGGEDFHRHLRTQAFRQLLETVLPTREQDERPSAARILACQGLADARGGAGDQGVENGHG